MANVAIQGHANRGKEVIEILEMLGGNNGFAHIGNNTNAIYYINEKYKNYIICSETINACDYTIFTLEEFLEKFPYKIGDKVITIDKFIGTITNIRWQGDSFFVGKEEGDIVYTIQVSTNAQITYQKEDLQSYKEEIMEEKLEQIILEIPVGYEFFGINDDNKVVLTKKQLKHPQTYEECCETLNVINTEIPYIILSLLGEPITSLEKLIVCRDAYWKIAGEQMGLGNPWEPDWTNNYQKKWIINFYQGEINFTTGPNVQFILAFPTVEMRDTFYENFKDLIEQCKELL